MGWGVIIFWVMLSKRFENREREQIPATNVFSRSVEQSRGSYDVPPFPIRRSEKIAGES